MEQDANFAQQLNERRLVAEALRRRRLGEQLARFKQLDKALAGNPSETTVRPMRPWAIAASVAALAIGLTFWFWSKSTSPHESIVAEVLQPYPTLGIVKGNDGTADRQQQALLAYDGGEYTQAIPDFRTGWQSGDYPENAFYLGLSFLLAESSPDSARYYLQLAPDALPALSDAARWYLALAHLRSGDTERSLELLNQLSDQTSGEWPTKARQLRRRLLNETSERD